MQQGGNGDGLRSDAGSFDICHCCRPDRGVYSFTYTITNPADDGALTYETSASWITNVSDSGSTISFNVSENDSDASRTGRISLSYKSSYGTESATVTVAQNAGAAPTLSVQPVAVTAETDGGTYSFSYTVTNPAADGELSCSTTVDWVTDFDYTTSGKVSFTVAANSTSAIRSADISVYYDSTYGTLEETVAVVQDHTGGSGGGSDFDGDLSSLYGTYEASGYALDTNTGATSYQTWTMTLYPDIYEGVTYDDVIIDGITPYYAGYRNSQGYALALGFGYLENGCFVIPTYQWYGYYYTDDDGNYVGYGYVSCAGYEDGKWYYSEDDCTFTYDSSAGSWTSDYGDMYIQMYLDINWYTYEVAITGLGSFWDASCPGVTIKKTSDDYGEIPSSVSQASAAKARQPKVAPYVSKTGSMVAHPLNEGLQLHTDYLYK